jgi:hypothetical protein
MSECGSGHIKSMSFSTKKANKNADKKRSSKKNTQNRPKKKAARNQENADKEAAQKKNAKKNSATNHEHTRVKDVQVGVRLVFVERHQRAHCVEEFLHTAVVEEERGLS